MTKELIAIPEEYLMEIVRIIRIGIKHTDNIDNDVKESLEQWCDEEEKYNQREQ